jgi:hypothetical protein
MKKHGSSGREPNEIGLSEPPPVMTNRDSIVEEIVTNLRPFKRDESYATERANFYIEQTDSAAKKASKNPRPPATLGAIPVRPACVVTAIGACGTVGVILGSGPV